MARYDVEKLARDIVNIEKKHSALSLATQLPNSSVRLSTGEEGDVAAGIEDGTDALANSETLYDYADEIGDLNDEDIDYGATVPEWILNAGSVGDTAWELADINNEAVTEALENADQAAADALAASQAAADAAVKAQEAMDALERSVVGTVIEYSVSESDTVPPSEGWSADNPEPAEGEFVWMRTVITYADETTSTSMPVLMSRGGESVKIDSITTYYARVALTTPNTFPPDLPTVLNPTSVWYPVMFEYVDGTWLFSTERIVYSDGSFAYTSAQSETAWFYAGKAQEEAEAAKFLAEGIYQVIPSVTEPTQAPNGSALKQGDQWWVIGGAGTPQEGSFVGVKVYDGTQWIDRQIVADSVLVPGSVGPVLIEDGAITGQKISAEAINGKTITGSTLFGSTIYGGYFSLDTISGNTIMFYDNCNSLSPDWGDYFGDLPAELNTTSYVSSPASISAVKNLQGWFYGLSRRNINVTMPSAGSLSFWINPEADQAKIWINITTTTTYERELPANTWTLVEIPLKQGDKIQSIGMYVGETSALGSDRFSIDDLKIVADISSDSFVEISRLSDGRAVVRSANMAAGEQTMLSEGSIQQVYLDPATPGSAYYVTSDTSGVNVTSDGATHYNIQTQIGRGDSINLISQNINLEGYVKMTELGEYREREISTVNNLTATSVAELPITSGYNFSVTTTHPVLYEIMYSFWLGGTMANNAARIGIELSGATTYNWNQPQWGNVLRATTQGSYQLRRLVVLNPGVTRVRILGHRESTSSTPTVAYNYLQAVPLRFD